MQREKAGFQFDDTRHLDARYIVYIVTYDTIMKTAYLAICIWSCHFVSTISALESELELFTGDSSKDSHSPGPVIRGACP